MKEPEARIMSEVAAGNASAFEAIVEYYRRPLIHFISRFTNASSEAEDIAQEVFLRVFKSAGEYRPEAKFKTWLFTIATNLCLNELRNNRTSARLVDPLALGESGFLAIAPDTYCPHRTLENKELGDVIRKAIGSLPPQQKAALILQQYHGFSYKEISQVMNSSPSAVESLIQRARQSLKKRLSLYL